MFEESVMEAESLNIFGTTVAIGVGATLFMDLWALAQSSLLGTRSLDYALVGRWIGHALHGQFRHAAIAKAAPIAGERALGWVAHYAIGVAFAALLLAIFGVAWAREPSLAPALLVGIGTIVFPFLVLQPAFGAGIAASRTPQPNVARLRSIVTHLSFGLGLYLAALATAAIGGQPPRWT
jgi:hypothetical protein